MRFVNGILGFLNRGVYLLKAVQQHLLLPVQILEAILYGLELDMVLLIHLQLGIELLLLPFQSLDDRQLGLELLV